MFLEVYHKNIFYLTDRIALSDYKRDTFIFTKDMLVEKTDNRIDISERRKGIREGAN